MSAEAMAIVILLLCWVAWIVFLVIHHYAKRKPKPKPRRLVVPAEHTRRVLELWDDYRDSEDGICVKRYDFWVAVNELLPETKDGSWKVESHAVQVEIVEVLK